MRSPQARIATLVLCTPDGSVLGRLPPFEAAVPWWQDAEALVGGARQRHGLEVRVLRLLDAALPGPPGGAVTYLAEVSQPTSAGVALDPWSGVLGSHPLRAPYAEPGGPERDLAWARGVLEDHAVHHTSPPEQVRTWNLSSLWRLPTDDGVFWLKCVPQFFAHEGPLLARLRGGPVPTVLAHERGRMLMPEVPGTDLYDADIETQLQLVSLLVDLQTAWSSRVDELITTGVPDWRTEALCAAIDGVVARTAPYLAPADQAVLTRFVDSLPERFSYLVTCGVPHSFVHGDFAPGNARGEKGSLTLLDWGDSTIGHPLLDQAAFLDRIPPEFVPRVRQHWDRAWRDAVPGCDPSRAADLLAPVAAARQAAVFQRFLDTIEPTEHPYHRGDPALWLTRAAELARGEVRGGQ